MNDINTKKRRSIAMAKLDHAAQLISSVGFILHNVLPFNKKEEHLAELAIHYNAAINDIRESMRQTVELPVGRDCTRAMEETRCVLNRWQETNLALVFFKFMRGGELLINEDGTLKSGGAA